VGGAEPPPILHEHTKGGADDEYGGLWEEEPGYNWWEAWDTVEQPHHTTRSTAHLEHSRGCINNGDSNGPQATGRNTGQQAQNDVRGDQGGSGTGNQTQDEALRLWALPLQVWHCFARVWVRMIRAMKTHRIFMRAICVSCVVLTS
jgi:hypothetical protein